MIPDSVQVSVHPALCAEQLVALPQTPGIYSLHIGNNAPHLSWCPNLRKRITRLLDPSYTLGERLRPHLTKIECWPTGSKLESMLLMHGLVKRHFPNDYMRRLRLRLPYFVAFMDVNGFPRLGTVQNLSRYELNSGIWGPFPSRDAAELYQEQTISLFQLRRCTETLSPREDHPGCIYGEINQCLRPCQAHVTQEEYGSEVQRVREFLMTNGRTLTASLTAARGRAAEDMDFEAAAQIHKRIEKVQTAITARDKVITELEEFHGVALTRGAKPFEFRLWPLQRCLWQPSLSLDFSQPSEQSCPLDVEIRERLANCLSAPQTEGQQIEDLAIFSRWYFSTWREGEWFPFRSLNDLNYRKLVRTLSAMAKESLKS